MTALLASCWALAIAGPLQVRSPTSCRDCHEDPARELAQTAHARAGIGCVDCHGGDPAPEDPIDAHDPEKGFIGAPDKRTIASLCGDCHADPRRMNPYRFPTDQLQQYRVSHHGEALLGEGDTDAATCTDCHGNHRILGPRDPASPVYPENIPATCGRCHADSELARRHGMQPDVVENYRGSVHAEVLFVKKDSAGPTCASCHGNHGAVPPGFADVGTVCGKCHVNEKAAFERSPHAAAAGEGRFEMCVSCHGNHRVLPADPGLYRAACLGCHGERAVEMSVRDVIEGIVASTLHRLEAERSRIERAKRAGMDAEKEAQTFEEARTLAIQLSTLQHTLDPTDVRSAGQSVIDLLDEIKGSLEGKERREQMKRLALVPIWLFLVTMAAGFWMLRARIRQARQEGDR